MAVDGRTPAQEGRPVYGIYHGIIQDAADSDRMGRIAVYIPEFKGPPQLKSSWTYVSYMSPFAGSTASEYETDDFKSFDSTKKSYGMWMVPPTKGTLVIVGFLSGDINQGVLLGCLYHQEKNLTLKTLFFEGKALAEINCC